MASNISFRGTNTGTQFGNNSGHANITQIFNSGPSSTDECLRDLRTTDPHDDKYRIQNTNGGLLKDSYRWILDNREFKQWQSEGNNENRLLWIRGDPGKGKTMLLCGVIDELNSTVETANVSFFFCQATDPRINNATAVLRGLIYSLVEKQPSLLRHVQARYSQAGKELFHDRNAGHALSRIFSDILKDSTMQSTYLIIDALDECTQDLPFLLDFIIKESAAHPQAKWIVSSRNWRDIEERFHAAAHIAPISLELNEVSVSEAVHQFIQHRIRKLVEVKKYDELTLYAISNHLLSNAHGTFLWVALVCQELTRTPRWQALPKLAAFPPGLNALYGRMIDQIRNSEGAELYKRILAVTSTVYRPTTLDELQSCMDMPDAIYDNEFLSEMIAFCGSFLTLRNNTVVFVHQSAKDFLVNRALADIFPAGIEAEHHLIFSRSLHVISKTLRRDIFGIKSPGFPIAEVRKPSPNPLRAAEYACLHWIDHLQDYNLSEDVKGDDLEDGGPIDLFLRTQYLHWLEALGLLGSVSEGIAAMLKLHALFQKMSKSQDLIKRVGDALRFIRYFKIAVEVSPLQVYISALVFSPTQSITRVCFQMESPKWVIMKSAPEYDWNLCLQTFEGYNTCVAWSHARNRLASAYPDGTINIWDPNTGQRVFNLTGHNESFTRTAMKESGYLGGSYTIQDLAWSPDGTRLASLGHDNIIKVWDSDTQQCISTLQEDANRIESFAWSYDGSRIAIVLLGYPSGKVKIWDPNTAQCMSILKHGRSTLESVAWSPDGRQLASSLWDSTVSIWNPLTSQCISTLGRVDDSGIKTFYSTEWSYDGSRLAIGYSDFVEIWNPQTGQPVLTFKGPPVDNATKRKIRITWSKDGTRLAVSLSTPSVIIWNSVTGQHISTLEGHENYVSAIAWSHVGSRLASGSEDCTIRIWNPVTAQCVSILRGHFGDTFALFWSRNGSQIISASADGAIKIWDPSTDHNLSTPDGHSDQIRSIAWSYDGRKLASVSNYMTVKIWDKYTGKCISTLEELHPHVTDIPVCISWSRHSTSLLSVILGKLRVWDPLTGQCISTLDHTSLIDFCVWSDEGTLVASSSRDAISSIIIIWNPFTNERLWVFKGHSVPVRTLAWSHCGTMLASAANLGGWSIRPLSEIMIWSLYTGQPLLSHRVDFKVSVMSWSNDDTRIVAGGQGIMIFDLTDGTFTINDAKVHGKEISCITWSRDGIKVASMSPDKKVYIWYLDGTGQIKGTKIGLCGWARFDEVDSNLLYTDTGILNLQHYLPDPSIPPTWERVGYGLKHDSCWITFEGKDLLWLPPEYRPVNSSLTAISGTTVAIGCSSGRVLILEFSELPKDLFAWS